MHNTQTINPIPNPYPKPLTLKPMKTLSLTLNPIP